MAAYLLNISVDTADVYPDHIPEDLSFNDQESMAEVVVEMVLGFEDAFEEYDDHDTEDHSKKKNVKTDPVVHGDSAPGNHHHAGLHRIVIRTCLAALLHSGYSDTDSPPPKV